jgi:hypothetical protein
LLNGQPLSEANSVPSPESKSVRFRHPITLRAGWNTLLFEVGPGKEANRLCLWLSAEPADRALALADNGRWAEALALVKQERARRPNHPDVLLLSARCYRRYADHLRRASPKSAAAAVADQDREARACYEKLLAREPDHTGYAAELADFLLPPSEAGTWTVLDPLTMTSAGGTTLTKQPDGSILASGKNPLPETYTITARAPLTTGITAIRLEVLADERLPGNGPGRATRGNFHLSTFHVKAAPLSEPARARPVVLQSAWGDFAQLLSSVLSVIPPGEATPQTREPMTIGWARLTFTQDRGWGVAPQTGRSHQAVFETREPISLPGGGGGALLTFTLDHRYRYFNRAHNIGRFRL